MHQLTLPPSTTESPLLLLFYTSSLYHEDEDDGDVHVSGRLMNWDREIGKFLNL